MTISDARFTQQYPGQRQAGAQTARIRLHRKVECGQVLAHQHALRKPKAGQDFVDPGKTRLINHFLINDRWYLVDLPGYGFAKISKDGREQLRKMILDYVLHSQEMVTLFVLVDSRHDIQKIDLEFLEMLGINGVPFALIFTKSDKQGPNVLKARIERNKEILSEQWEEFPPMFASSTKTGAGREEILDYIGTLLKRTG